MSFSERWTVLLALMVLASCGQKPAEAAGGNKGTRAAPQFPVEVQPIQARAVEYVVNAVGSIEAFERVQVTARVAGVVEKVRFVEGDTVAARQSLVEIEPERYSVAVKLARAALQRASATKEDAQKAFGRRESANTGTPGIMAPDELDQFRGRVQIAAADEEAARASLEKAEIDLRDAFVRSPIAGIIETRTVQTGQYVQPGTVLATLIRREPLMLRFQVAEQDAAHLQPKMRTTFRVRGGRRPLTAVITHVSDVADGASRLVPVTARIDDPDRKELRPGSFAEVSVAVGGKTDTPVIPQTSVRPSERGFLAFVVNENKAQERVLALGLRTGDGLVEVRSGVTPGEMIVVRGAEALRDGASVRVVPEQGGKKEGEPRPASTSDRGTVR